MFAIQIPAVFSSLWKFYFFSSARATCSPAYDPKLKKDTFEKKWPTIPPNDKSSTKVLHHPRQLKIKMAKMTGQQRAAQRPQQPARPLAPRLFEKFQFSASTSAHPSVLYIPRFRIFRRSPSGRRTRRTTSCLKICRNRRENTKIFETLF